MNWKVDFENVAVKRAEDGLIVALTLQRRRKGLVGPAKWVVDSRQSLDADTRAQAEAAYNESYKALITAPPVVQTLRVTCHRCSHQWVPRTERPVECPSCKTRLRRG